MSEPITCPAPECDFEGPAPNVKKHFFGKQDEAHSGGEDRFLSLLTAGSNSQPEATESGGSDGGSGAGENPAFAGPEGSGSAATDGGGKTEVELPCGCESVDISAEPWSSQIEEHGAARARCDTCDEEAYLYP